jgi:hypothetical protein
MDKIDYLQSKNDTPCRIWAKPQKYKSPPDLLLSKWEDEAYLQIKTAGKYERVRTVENQGNRFCIETNKRKHIITRLDSERIEYDIIIGDAPRLGEIRLPLTFPRGLDFYKQGRDGQNIEPHIKGSYAVYWKQKNNKYKTGKLCHIYRPEIIDSKGRRCWGKLDYDGTGLVMSIPEGFLKACSYPVTVDPLIGTSSVGSQHLKEDGGDWYDYYYEMIMPANRYTVVDPVNGSCTAHIYSYHSDSEARGYPCLYGNSGSNPASRLSSSEVYADLRSPNASGEWLSAGFNVAGNISAGSTVWLAFMTHYYFFPYFDNGGTAREMDVESESTPPNTFVPGGWTPDPITLSMYFSYVSAQNYTRSITNNEGITDSMRRIAQSIRQFEEPGTSLTDNLNRSKGMSRDIASNCPHSDSIQLRTGFGRIITVLTTIGDAVTRSIGHRIKIITEIAPASAFSSLLTRIRKIADLVEPVSLFSRLYDSLRRINELPQADDQLEREQELKRPQSETPAVNDGFIRRAFKKILITGFIEIWDYITHRKVKSKEELKIMSRITTEFEIESRIS